ncbi:hypothetical protein NL676_029819 [Syzygium grande]|nr:hypothetical protein NL676_029819 [Syzygium grande]
MEDWKARRLQVVEILVGFNELEFIDGAHTFEAQAPEHRDLNSPFSCRVLTIIASGQHQEVATLDLSKKTGSRQEDRRTAKGGDHSKEGRAVGFTVVRSSGTGERRDRRTTTVRHGRAPTTVADSGGDGTGATVGQRGRARGKTRATKVIHGTVCRAGGRWCDGEPSRTGKAMVSRLDGRRARIWSGSRDCEATPSGRKERGRGDVTTRSDKQMDGFYGNGEMGRVLNKRAGTAEARPEQGRADAVTAAGAAGVTGRLRGGKS